MHAVKQTTLTHFFGLIVSPEGFFHVVVRAWTGQKKCFL